MVHESVFRELCTIYKQYGGDISASKRVKEIRDWLEYSESGEFGNKVKKIIEWIQSLNRYGTGVNDPKKIEQILMEMKNPLDRLFIGTDSAKYVPASVSTINSFVKIDPRQLSDLYSSVIGETDKLRDLLGDKRNTKTSQEINRIHDVQSHHEIALDQFKTLRENINRLVVLYQVTRKKYEKATSQQRQFLNPTIDLTPELFSNEINERPIYDQLTLNLTDERLSDSRRRIDIQLNRAISELTGIDTRLSDKQSKLVAIQEQLSFLQDSLTQRTEESKSATTSERIRSMYKDTIREAENALAATDIRQLESDRNELQKDIDDIQRTIDELNRVNINPDDVIKEYDVEYEQKEKKLESIPVIVGNINSVRASYNDIKAEISSLDSFDKIMLRVNKLVKTIEKRFSRTKPSFVVMFKVLDTINEEIDYLDVARILVLVHTMLDIVSQLSPSKSTFDLRVADKLLAKTTTDMRLKSPPTDEDLVTIRKFVKNLLRTDKPSRKFDEIMQSIESMISRLIALKDILKRAEKLQYQMEQVYLEVNNMISTYPILMELVPEDGRERVEIMLDKPSEEMTDGLKRIAEKMFEDSEAMVNYRRLIAHRSQLESANRTMTLKQQQLKTNHRTEIIIRTYPSQIEFMKRVSDAYLDVRQVVILFKSEIEDLNIKIRIETEKQEGLEKEIEFLKAQHEENKKHIKQLNQKSDILNQPHDVNTKLIIFQTITLKLIEKLEKIEKKIQEFFPDIYGKLTITESTLVSARKSVEQMISDGTVSTDLRRGGGYRVESYDDLLRIINAEADANDDIFSDIFDLSYHLDHLKYEITECYDQINKYYRNSRHCYLVLISMMHAFQRYISRPPSYPHAIKKADIGSFKDTIATKKVNSSVYKERVTWILDMLERKFAELDDKDVYNYTMSDDVMTQLNMLWVHMLCIDIEFMD